MSDTVSLKFVQVTRREWDIAVDLAALQAAVAKHAPEWFGWSSFAEAIDDIANNYADRWSLIMADVHQVDDGITTDTEFEDFESDAVDFETCSECGDPLNEHCEDCGECECECDDDEEEDDDDE